MRYCLSDVTEDFLKDIQVPYIPYNINVKADSQFIISPISSDIYSSVCNKFITDRVVTLEDFKKLIVNTYDFKNVVDFVWKSRKSMYGQEHVKKSSIREFYVKYIEDIYNAITAGQFFQTLQKGLLKKGDYSNER